MSRSAYIAHVDKEKCVACGKCVEVCPAGAARLGQKLCTKEGPVKYPKHELPDAVKWGPDKWSLNYKELNQLNCYDSGTSPCKTACPAHIAVQGYIKMAAQGRYLDALKLIKQDNPFPAVCGSICNRRCEDACTRGRIDEALAIDEIKKFVADLELKEETRYIPPRKNFKPDLSPFPEKIAVEIEISSPVTVSHYVGAWKGQIYGYAHRMADHAVARLGMKEDDHFIEGLEFAGAHGMSGDGMGPQITNGRAAAKAVREDLQKKEKEGKR